MNSGQPPVWRSSAGNAGSREAVETITVFAPLWEELFPAEQARIVRLLVERIDVAPDGFRVWLRAERLQTLVEELQSPKVKAA